MIPRSFSLFRLRVLACGVAIAAATLAHPWSLGAQAPAPASGVRFATISEADMKAFLTYLASDELQGRQVYTEGYGLAAAYAKIGRKQCSINFLTRMLQMRPHPSKKVEVEAYIDKLLGRRQPLDPDFAEMRRDKGFRELIAKMCEGTNDPNCVYGAQKEGRER